MEGASPATPSQPTASPTPASSFGVNTATSASSDAGDASDAKSTFSATHATQEAPLATQSSANPLNQETASTAVSDAAGAISDASDAAAVSAALVDARVYNVTVPQAQELFAQLRRRVPAARTIQNYCADGLIAGEKVSTATGAEWLINDESLLAFIQSKPEVETTPMPPIMEVTPLADRPAPEPAPVVSTEAAAEIEEPAPRETRTIAQMLVENARLAAELQGTRQVIEGKDETIAELKSDREFLRDEIKDKRRLNQDLKDITSQVLQLLDNMVEARNPQLRMADTTPEPAANPLQSAPEPAREAQYNDPTRPTPGHSQYGNHV